MDWFSFLVLSFNGFFVIELKLIQVHPFEKKVLRLAQDNLDWTFVSPFFIIGFKSPLLSFSLNLINIRTQFQSLFSVKHEFYRNPISPRGQKPKLLFQKYMWIIFSSDSRPTTCINTINKNGQLPVRRVHRCDGYWRLNMLVTCLRCWWPIYFIEKITNIMALLPKLWICHHHKTNIPLSPMLLFEVRQGHSNKLTSSLYRRK